MAVLLHCVQDRCRSPLHLPSQVLIFKHDRRPCQEFEASEISVAEGVVSPESALLDRIGNSHDVGADMGSLMTLREPHR